MKIHETIRLTVSLAVGLLLLLGGMSSSRADESSKADNKTLPPREAAKACLTTAEEMLKGGYRQEAIALYERVRQLDPSQKQISRNLAVLYDEAGFDAKAAAEYNLALQLTPNDADLWNDQGYFLFSRGNFPSAEQAYRNAIRLSPQHERAWTNLAILLGDQGRDAECFDAFCKVLSPAAAHSNMGMILAKHNRREAAIAAFHRAIEMDPQLKQPRAVLAYLEKPTTTNPQTASRPDASGLGAGQTLLR